MKKYFLGVDQGGTKTDYLLCTTDGEFVDFYNTVNNIRYENIVDIEEKMSNYLKRDITLFLRRNGVLSKEVAASGFALATIPVGVTKQQALYKKLEKRIGLKNTFFVPDPVAALYTDKSNGVGISVLAGTGCVVSGMNETGKIMTVGGLNHLSDDKAGGMYLRDTVLSLLYKYYFRCGANSIMFDELTELLNINEQNCVTFLATQQNIIVAKTTEIITIADNAALLSDPLAKQLFDDAGENMAQAAAGAINYLQFEKLGTPENPIPIMLMGSIWQKVVYNGMRIKFTETLKTLTDKECRVVLYDRPPVISGLMLARTQYESDPAVRETETVEQCLAFRKNIVSSVVYRLASNEINEFIKKASSDGEKLRFLLTFNKNRNELAEKTGVNTQIKQMLAKYPILRTMPPGMATAFMPVVCAVADDDYDKALSWFTLAHVKLQIPKGSETEVIQFGINIAAAAEAHDDYIRLTKLKITHLIETGHTKEAKNELTEFLTLLPEDEELITLNKRVYPT